MSDDSTQEEKQNFLRENILDKGYDTNMFVEFLMGKKGEEGADVGNWSMNDLQLVVKEFISMHSNINNSPQEQTDLNNQIPPSLKNDPLSNPPQIQKNNEPNPKYKIQNDPLQNNKVQNKKQSIYDPLSGGFSQTKETQKKQNSSMSDFFSMSNNNQKTQNVKTQPQIQTQINQPQMQNQFPQPFFKQFPNFPNQMQQNQLNQQYQPQMIKEQGQFHQLIIPNQEQQKTLQNNTQNSQQTINPEIKNQQISPEKNSVTPPLPDSQNKNSPEKSDLKIDVGILYGIITLPTEESKVFDKTPLGISDNPSIQVGFPEKIEGGFFSKSYVTYLVTTMPLNIKVRRRYSDFEWLRQILTNLYVGNVIPTTPRKNKIGSDKFGDAFLQKRMRTLEKFLNNLLMNPIIKYSQIFYDFVSIENEADFNKKKKEYEKMKPPQNINENQSLAGRVNIEVKKEKEIFFENIKDNISLNESLLLKLNENLKLLKVQIENVTMKIDEIVQIWNELCKTSTKYFDGDDIIQTYEHMSKLFTNWSDALKRHNNIVHIDIREYFKYVKNTFKSMKDLVSIVDSNRAYYNKNEKYLINKKEELFRKGDINKWELDASDRDNANKLLQDKNTALMKIIPKETNNVINIKKVYGYYLNRIIDEYERIKLINSSLHKANLLNACAKITEIYRDFQKGNAEIITFFNTKDKNGQNSNIISF